MQTSFRFLFCSVLSLASTLALPAQSLTLRGGLADGRATGCYYCPNSQFVIKFSETPVRSSVVNLALFQNLDLALTGTWNSTVSPPGLDVTAVQVVAESHSTNGSGRIGDKIRFAATANPGDTAALAIAFANGFVPLPGTALLISPATLFVLGGGTIGGGGEFKIDVPIPNQASLVGLHVFSQGLIVPGNATKAIYSTNPRMSVLQ